MNIKQLKPNKYHCKTCPFRPIDGDGGTFDQGLANKVIARNGLQTSQVCHDTKLKGRTPTSLCRGHRDYLLKLLFRLGCIESPTDDAYNYACQDLTDRLD